MPPISLSANALLAARRPCSTTASSSAVRSGTVAIRQCSITRSPSNTPRTVLVFPMSMVSSITGPLFGGCITGLPFRGGIIGPPFGGCITGLPFGGRVDGQYDRHIIDQPRAADSGRRHQHRWSGLTGLPHRRERTPVDDREVVDGQGGIRPPDLLPAGAPAARAPL